MALCVTCWDDENRAMISIPKKKNGTRGLTTTLRRWFDSGCGDSLPAGGAGARRVDWLRCLPFFGMHVACLGVVWVGVSAVAVGVAVGLYLIRMFAITAFYHRYFSHRTFSTSRPAQFLFAVLGNSAAQRGPLWWASHHRHHHQHSDTEEDAHSPGRHGFLWSHFLWFTSRANFPTRTSKIQDFVRYPELRFLDRFDILTPLLLGVLLFVCGEILRVNAPGLGTSGPQLLIWGIISTVVLFHASCAINSVAHCFGRRRFSTRDASRNSLTLALLTLGEGWHNNHHHFPASARQGFYWWEVDLTYYVLKLLSWLGIIWDLRPVPPQVLDLRRSDGVPARAGFQTGERIA